MSLVDFLDSMEEQEEEMSKVAAEEDAAGRIMARGFMDELNKLAAQMGPVRDKPEQMGPTQAAYKKDMWKKNMPKHRETGPYGLKSGEKPPKIGPGLQAFGGRIPSAPKDNLRTKMMRKKFQEQKHRPTGAYGMKRKAKRVGSAVAETGKAYGKTLKEFGKGISRNIRGE